MKVSILSNGKITTTQYSNVAIDGKVEVMGGVGIEVETDPIFTDWRTETGDKLVTDVASVQSEVSTLSGEVATVSSELEGKADKSEIPEMPDLSGYATTDSVTADLATKANTADVYTKEQVYTKTEVNEALDDKADKSDVDDNTACITALNNSITSINESVIVLGSDKADKTAVDANTACITALNNSITALGSTVANKADASTVSALCATVATKDDIRGYTYDSSSKSIEIKAPDSSGGLKITSSGEDGSCVQFFGYYDFRVACVYMDTLTISTINSCYYSTISFCAPVYFNDAVSFSSLNVSYLYSDYGCINFCANSIFSNTAEFYSGIFTSSIAAAYGSDTINFCSGISIGEIHGYYGSTLCVYDYIDLMKGFCSSSCINISHSSDKYTFSDFKDNGDGTYTPIFTKAVN